jgi:hypothetical protein
VINAQDIAQFMQDPARLSEVNPDDLAQLAEKYPYSQIFSILYLQSLGIRHDLRFDEELVKHSFRITDRARLYRLVYDYQSPASQEADTLPMSPELSEAPTAEEITAEEIIAPELTKASEIPAVVVVQCEVDVPLEEAKQGQALEETAEVAPEEVEKEYAQPREEVQTVSLVEEESAEYAAKEEEEIETEEVDPLEKLILQHAVATSYQLEELSEDEIKELELRKAAKDVPAVNQEENPSAEEVTEKPSFTSWFSSNRNAVPEDKAEQNAVRSIVRNFEYFDPSDELFGEVEKPKKEFFSPARKAKESLREDDLPVSETLAKIYAMQGNYPKAIHAYEQLSLIYPEKKTFFATLIADLEQKLNLK